MAEEKSYHEVETMELTMFPVLEDHISASQIISPGGSELLLYDTVTGARKFPNEAVFNFLNLANGAVSFREIVEELSNQSGESEDKIWPGLSAVTEKLVKNGLLKVSDRPFFPLRKPPPSVRLIQRLENVSFEATRACNLRCKHCYANAGEALTDELSLEEIYALIDQLADVGVLNITFTGGEPLLHPHLFEMMEYARKKPLSVTLFTNATLITPAVAQKLRELSVIRVNVSIDGPDSESHDQFRGMEGAFEKTIRGVKLLKEAGLTIHASTSLTRMNYRKVKEMLKLLKELGVEDSKLWPPTFSGRGNDKEVFITPEEFREVMKAMREFSSEEGKEKEEFRYSKSMENCGVGWSALVIKCNGAVTPCPSFGEEFSLGTIRERSVADIWNNAPLLNRLRAMSVFETEECKGCTLAAVCKGGCIADVYMRTGTFSCHDPYMCVAFEVTKDDFVPVEVDDTHSGECALHFQSIG